MRNKKIEVFRGDIFYVQKGFCTGSEQEAGRPAIIVSNDTGNRYSTCVEVVYLTTQEKTPMPTHVSLVCKVQSTALCEQVFTVAKERLSDFVRRCTDEEMQKIDKALMISLGIPMKNDERIGELETALQNAGHALTAARAQVDLLQAENAALEEKQDASKGQEPLIVLMTERELYKALYESMLEKLIAAR